MGCNGDDSGEKCNLFGDEKIKYPVSFDLKVIMENKQTDKENITAIKNLLNESNIPFSDFRKKQSSKGTYTSYTVGITTETQEILEKLYVNLKAIPGVIYAV